MDEENNHPPNSDATPLEPWVDPALEARIVALILGETNLEDDQHNTTPDQKNPTPDQATSQLEATGLVRAFLAQLDPKDRELIHLKYTQDKSYAEIAKQTDLTIGNVGYTLHHLLRNLASSLRQAGVSDSRG